MTPSFTRFLESTLFSLLPRPCGFLSVRCSIDTNFCSIWLPLSIPADIAGEPKSTWSCPLAGARCCFPCSLSSPCTDCGPTGLVIQGTTQFTRYQHARFCRGRPLQQGIHVPDALCTHDFLRGPEGCCSCLGTANPFRPGNNTSYSSIKWQESPVSLSLVRCESPLPGFPSLSLPFVILALLSSLNCCFY